MTVEEKLFRCWQGGLGIRSTVKSVKLATGKRLNFEDVRIRFVRLSEMLG